MLKKLSSFGIIFTTLAFTSAAPLAIILVGVISLTSAQVEEEQERQLLARVNAQAEAINNQFREFETATVVAAARAAPMLRREILLTEAEEAQRLAKYARDERGVYGLDKWYDTVYAPRNGDNRLSNLYLNRNTVLTDQLAYLAAVTEDLNPVFEAVVARNINTQWIYLTTRQGMMRLYPWHYNNYDNGNPDWQPNDFIFYTIAAEERNPAREPVWTPAYNDFAGAGLMVTNAVPIYDAAGEVLLGVMAHDFLIDSLQSQVLGFEVGEAGFAFLLNSTGGVVAHKDYNPENAPLGAELSIKLAAEEPEMGALIERMLGESVGLGRYDDVDDETWVVAYDTIEATNWHLGLAQPRSEIIAPATNVITQIMLAAVVLVFISLPLSAFLARRLTRPILQLSDAARRIEASVDAETAQGVTHADLAHIRGTVEIDNLVSVFRQMVAALRARLNELNSLYAISQTMTSQIEYTAALRSVLEAVNTVVEYDAAEVAVLEGDRLVVEVWNGREGFRDTTGKQYRIDSGLTGLVVAAQQPVLESTVTDEMADASRTLASSVMASELLGRSTKLLIQSFLGLPLLVQDRLVGVITLFHHEAGYFTEDDERKLGKLAAQASIAIDNALQVRRREQELKAQIRELQIQIDETKAAQEVEAVVSSEYFQQLRDQASAMRRRGRRRHGRRNSEDQNE